MLPVFYKNKCLKSTIYSLLLGVFFLLVSVANRFNFATIDPTLDTAPSTSDGIEIATVPVPSAPISPATNFVAKRPMNYISIGGRTATIYRTGSLADDAGSRVAHYGSNFYYGHRTAALGVLPNLSDGATFSITENGITNTYRIARHETFIKSGTNGLRLATDPVNINYSNAIYSASYRGKKYDLALMTCAGASLGGGDATERYVVFAYKV